MKAEPPIIAFLGGIGTDSQGRLLNDIWAFSDAEIERTHNFIQWLFPLAEASLSVPGSPTLTSDEIATLRLSVAAKTSIVESADWYTAFLSRNSHWKAKYDHNHLRITRAIKALRLLVSDDEANRFRDGVFALLGDGADLTGEKARSFWMAA
ncbi:opioid growth factor receptor-related protein [Candidatus Puniceispirillum sp.]|nr:opioid growth factor receptor-related protein [Candidatus Puniceispirillum sp.]